MRQMRKSLVLWSTTLVACAAVVFPAVSLAQGNAGSATDEYTETLPGAGGDHPTAGGDHHGPNAPDQAQLPGSADEDLRGTGADGAAVADLAEQTAPPTGSGGSHPAGSAADSSDADAQAHNGPSDNGGGVGDVVDTVLSGSPGGSGGMGVALPIAIVVTALGAIAILVYRRRTGNTPRGV